MKRILITATLVVCSGYFYTGTGIPAPESDEAPRETLRVTGTYKVESALFNDITEYRFELETNDREWFIRSEITSFPNHISKDGTSPGLDKSLPYKSIICGKSNGIYYTAYEINHNYNPKWDRIPEMKDHLVIISQQDPGLIDLHNPVYIIKKFYSDPENRKEGIVSFLSRWFVQPETAPIRIAPIMLTWRETITSAPRAINEENPWFRTSLFHINGNL